MPKKESKNKGGRPLSAYRLTREQKIARCLSVQAEANKAGADGRPIGIKAACKKIGIAAITYYKTLDQVAPYLHEHIEKKEEIKLQREVIDAAFENHDFPDPKHLLNSEQRAFINILSRNPEEMIACQEAGISVTKYYYWFNGDPHFAQAVKWAKEEAVQWLRSKVFKSASGIAKEEDVVNVSAAREYMKMTEETQDKKKGSGSKVTIKNKVKI